MHHVHDEAESNRRQERRYRGQCRQVFWTRDGGEPLPGVLCDFSASGASIMLSGEQVHSPAAGEHITLRRAEPQAQSQIYQVRRVDQVGCGYVVAGCCRSVAVEQLDDGVRLPSLRAAAEPPALHFYLSPRRHASHRGLLGGELHFNPPRRNH